MKEPTIKCSETYGFTGAEQLHAFIDEIVTPKKKGNSNLFAVKTDEGVILLDGETADETFQEEVKNRFKSVLASYPIDSIKCDITTISRFLDEDEIKDENYNVLKQISGQVVVVSEEEPVSDTDAAALFKSVIGSVNAGQVKQQVLVMALLNDRSDEDGIIHRNLIVRWFNSLEEK